MIRRFPVSSSGLLTILTYLLFHHHATKPITAFSSAWIICPSRTSRGKSSSYRHSLVLKQQAVGNYNEINEKKEEEDGAAVTSTYNLPLPPPPDPTSNPEDDGIRKFRQTVPTFVQHFMRDSGICRTLSDSLVLLGVPALLKEQPHTLGDFLRLTQGTKITNTITSLFEPFSSSINISKNNTQLNPTIIEDIQVTKLVYGSDDPKRQFVSMIETRQQPNQHHQNDDANDRNENIVVFVHGGAWGSGFPGMYSLVATPFLNVGYTKVAMVGYRTFPTSQTIQDQVDDITHALEVILEQNPTKKIAIIGHSSGAHILSMGFVQNQFHHLSSNIDTFVGMAGCYDIYSHYKFEQGRGVDRLSPMAKICDYSASGFRKNSPTYLARKAKANKEQCVPARFPPNTILVHGDEDNTLSYESTKEMAETGDIPWKFLRGVGHAEMVFDLMFGGTTQDFILNWLDRSTAE